MGIHWWRLWWINSELNVLFKQTRLNLLWSFMTIFKQLMTFTTARCSDEPGELLSLHANFMQITSLFYSGALYFVLKNCGKTRKTWIDRSIGQEWVAHRRHEFVHQVAAPSFRHTPLWGGGGRRKKHEEHVSLCEFASVHAHIRWKCRYSMSARWLCGRPLWFISECKFRTLLWHGTDIWNKYAAVFCCATNRHGYKVVNIRSGADDVFIDCGANFVVFFFKRGTLIRFKA